MLCSFLVRGNRPMFVASTSLCAVRLPNLMDWWFCHRTKCDKAISIKIVEATQVHGCNSVYIIPLDYTEKSMLLYPSKYITQCTIIISSTKFYKCIIIFQPYNSIEIILVISGRYRLIWYTGFRPLADLLNHSLIRWYKSQVLENSLGNVNNFWIICYKKLYI